MNNKYKCVKPFSVQNYDDNGFSIDNSYTNIDKDSVWEQDTSEFRMVGAYDTIRLENEKGEWLEITKESLSENFEPYKKPLNDKGLQPIKIKG